MKQKVKNFVKHDLDNLGQGLWDTLHSFVEPIDWNWRAWCEYLCMFVKVIAILIALFSVIGIAGRGCTSVHDMHLNQQRIAETNLVTGQLGNP